MKIPKFSFLTRTKEPTIKPTQTPRELDFIIQIDTSRMNDKAETELLNTVTDGLRYGGFIACNKGVTVLYNSEKWKVL